MEQELLGIINEAVAKKLIGGAVVSAGARSREYIRLAAGLADPQTGRAMASDTVFDLASVTKVMGTTTLLALGIDRGLVDPDAPFKKYLPEFKGVLHGPVTVRDIAMHIAGIGTPYKALPGEQEKMIDGLLRIDAVRPPRVKYEYSCVNFILLGLMLEKQFGRTLDAEAEESIFRKLGMNDTAWGAPVPGAVPRTIRTINAAPGTISDFGAAAMHPHPTGNAGIFSTADDIGKFARMMLARGDGFFSPGTAKELFTSRTPSAVGRRHALGWDMASDFIPEFCSEETVFHSGWTGQTLWIDPENDLLIAVLTNRTGDHAEAKKMRFALANVISRGILSR